MEMKERSRERWSEDFTDGRCSSASSTCFGSSERHSVFEESLSSVWSICDDDKGNGFPPLVGWSEKMGTPHEEKIDGKKSEIEMIKHKFSKLLLGEDMSGGSKGVCSALAISNAITNLSATVFGELWRLEPLPSEKKSMWRVEMESLTCVGDHIVELVPSWQTLPDGSKLEVMECKPRSDIDINLPALRKLDNMLLEILDSFDKNEFFYVDQAVVSESNRVRSLQGTSKHQEENRWLPVPKVPPSGLHEESVKQLKHKRDSLNQILKASVSINDNVLEEMVVPESYLESLPKNARACLGDLILRYITSVRFSADTLLDHLNLSSNSKYQALQYANRFEASIYLWRKRANKKLAATTEGSYTRSSWEMVKYVVLDADQKELFAARAENLLHGLKQRFPALLQTCLDKSKIQHNKDVGFSILESYSRVLANLAFNVARLIDDLLYVDGEMKSVGDCASSSPTHSIMSSLPSSPSPYPLSPSASSSPLSILNHKRGVKLSSVKKSKPPSHGVGSKKSSTLF